MTLDPEKQKQAKEYARIGRRLWLVDTAFSAVYALAWLFLGWSISLRIWLSTLITDNWSLTVGADWLLIAFFIAVFGGIYAILNLPLSYYSGFVLPHRYGQSNQSIKDWVIDQIKGLAIAIPLGLLLLELLYLMCNTFDLSSNQAIQIKRMTAEHQIQEYTDCVSQNFTYQPVLKMPKIVCADLVNAKPFC
jgi:hypothetical protein